MSCIMNLNGKKVTDNITQDWFKSQRGVGTEQVERSNLNSPDLQRIMKPG